MKFQDLPTEVQIIAAQSLASKIAEQGALPCNENDLNQCSAAIANAFVSLYFPQQPDQVQNDND
ncbi:hypothetical protein V6E00_07350 [Serratia marcescens]|uniref:hypothetical protein n=1 Tax=Serratia TaxID=613 RepID=UPI001E420357|nr:MULTISPECIES: hypothetical protein [unclassified Serratia (in: enterobacteria)]